MARSQVFNPLSGQFDTISEVTIGTANGLSITAAQALSLTTASTSTTGALTSTDWNTFNNKQPAGSYITALTGDATAAGPGSAALTLATVNANTGNFGSSSAIPTLTLNAKGLVVAATTNGITAPAGALTGNTLASGVTLSSLTSVDVLTVGTWHAGIIGTLYGGTGQNLSASTGAISVSSGTVSAGTLSVANGGTGQTSYTDGQLLIGNTSGNTLTKATITAGTGISVTNGNGSITIDNTSPSLLLAPTSQVFTSGSGTYNKNYAFTITSGSATVGATYTNNGITYTVYQTVASATLVYMSGSGAPTASGTLTKSGGTGDSTITFSSNRAPLYLIVDVLGGGGGGGGSGATATNGTAGNNSTFGTGSFIIAGGGSLGSNGGNGGAGGTNTFTVGSTGAVALINTTGNGGRGGAGSGSVPAGSTGNYGGFGPFGGQSGTNFFGAAVSGDANSGCGGNGAGAGVAPIQDGAGAGAGGYVKVQIPNPSATYTYAVGASANGGNAGTSGYAGAAGASGKVIVQEFYQ